MHGVTMKLDKMLLNIREFRHIWRRARQIFPVEFNETTSVRVTVRQFESKERVCNECLLRQGV